MQSTLIVTCQFLRWNINYYVTAVVYNWLHVSRTFYGIHTLSNVSHSLCIQNSWLNVPTLIIDVIIIIRLDLTSRDFANVKICANWTNSANWWTMQLTSSEFAEYICSGVSLNTNCLIKSSYFPFHLEMCKLMQLLAFNAIVNFPRDAVDLAFGIRDVEESRKL